MPGKDRMFRSTARLLFAPVFAVLSGAVASAEPAAPVFSDDVAMLNVGVFCALRAMDKVPAPGTMSGWMHVPDHEIDFHWPDRQVVPASLGLAFGVKLRLAPGPFVADGEMRVYRPGSTAPEYWETGFSDLEDSFSFFRFDTEAELITGIWRFEGWDGEEQLFSVEFEVVPAAAVPGIVDACGAVS
jgi:hypothetical protein